MKEVYAIGGSILTENLDKLQEYGEALNSKDQQLAVVTGAGKLKEYIDVVPNDVNHAQKDLIGIKATRLNAETLKAVVDCHPKTPEKPEEILEIASTNKNLIMGGLTPGYSTDAVAAITAELTDAERLYIASNIDGIYNKKPEKQDSKKLEEVKISRIRKMIEGNSGAGRYDLIDSTALEIIERSNIETKILHGVPKNIKNPEEVEGTKIVFD